MQRWHERHPLIFDWLKRGSWALLATAFAGSLAWPPGRRLLFSELQIPFWVVAVLITSVITLSTALSFALVARNREPKYLKFNLVQFHGVNFRWHYEKDEPLKPTPFCPNCDGQELKDTHLFLHIKIAAR
jgi:hypothetical protein